MGLGWPGQAAHKAAAASTYFWITIAIIIGDTPTGRVIRQRGHDTVSDDDNDDAVRHTRHPVSESQSKDITSRPSETRPFVNTGRDSPAPARVGAAHNARANINTQID